MAHLFDPLTLRGLRLPHRILVSPMCQYSSTDGFSTDWHFVHLGTRAVGGAALVFTEAAAVTPEGRISPDDLGLWNDAHVSGLARIVRFVHDQGAAAGTQLAHSGRKGSTKRPWDGPGFVTPAERGWQPVGPVAQPFATGHLTPRALSIPEIASVVDAFRQAALRAHEAGFDVVEIHAAHGYLIHEFLSPLTNTRDDAYGSGFDGRLRLCLEIVEAVREVWPDGLPLFVRISATDWTPGGWDVEQSVELARRLATRGVDLIDCSSGGNVAGAAIPATPGYQVPFAARIKREVGVATGAVGLITSPDQANTIVEEGQADCVLLARELLRDPYWPLRAARELGHSVSWPAQYLRAAPPDAVAREPRQL